MFNQSIAAETGKLSQTNFYVDLIPLPNFIKHPEKPNILHTSISDIITEAKSLFNLAFPIALTALILYSRSIISMLFLGHLGDTQLAAGSLAMAFANIIGYSVLSGLALGMEPLCSQAFGAQRPKVLSLTLHHYVIFLLITSILISFLWLNMFNIMVYLYQDPYITRIGHRYLLFSLPDLFTNSFSHPIRIYLRAQGITHPVTLATLIATVLHLPLNFLLVSHFNYGIVGIAVSASISNFFVLASLVAHVCASGVHEPTWEKPSFECLTGWKPLWKLAAPSCVSVCLEWWWYEIMIVLCGLLVNPKTPVASMGILIQTTSLIYVFPSSLSFALNVQLKPSPSFFFISQLAHDMSPSYIRT